MAKLPEVDPIRKAMEHRKIPQELRPYLGYSMLGHHCSRYMWYYFRWCFKTEIDPRLQRLFNRGHNEEPVVVAELRAIGVECKNVLDDQYEVVGPFGHIKGHPDGDVLGVPGAEKTWHNLEIKTANDKKFTEFSKFGIKRSNPQYYIQSLAYMHHKQQDRTLFVVTNKNNDERYYERLHYDKDDFEAAEAKGVDVICSDQPPRKISEQPEWYLCKWCDAYEVCHYGKKIERNCRTCSNASIKDGGEWHCSIYKQAIPVDFQRTGCPDNYRPFL